MPEALCRRNLQKSKTTNIRETFVLSNTLNSLATPRNKTDHNSDLKKQTKKKHHPHEKQTRFTCKRIFRRDTNKQIPIDKHAPNGLFHIANFEETHT